MCSLPLPDRQPYVYVIRNVATGIKYCGCKFAKGCKPEDLLVSYMTSSKVVKKLISEGATFCIDYVVPVATKEEAIELEELVLSEFNAHISDKWYNLSISGAVNPDHVKATCLEKYGVDNWMRSDNAKGLGFKEGNTYGCFKRSEETKARMSKAFTGRTFSEEHRNNISKARTGTKASAEARQKMSDVRKGVKRPASFSEKMSVKMSGENNPMFGKVSHRKGVKDEQHVCEHCLKLVSKGNLIRWHNDNCKLKHKEQ
jgi:hypothetical protein